VRHYYSALLVLFLVTGFKFVLPAHASDGRGLYITPTSDATRSAKPQNQNPSTQGTITRQHRDGYYRQTPTNDYRPPAQYSPPPWEEGEGSYGDSSRDGSDWDREYREKYGGRDSKSNAPTYIEESPKEPVFDDLLTGFIYDATAPIRYDQLKLIWLNDHPGTTPVLGDLMNIAYVAFQAQATQKIPYRDISEWRMVAGPHPWIIVPRVHVRNPNPNKSFVNLTIKVEVFAKYGIWYPEKKGAITDVKRLQQDQKTERVAEYTYPLEALAPNDDYVHTLEPIQVFELLKAFPDRWPNLVQVKMTLMREGGQVATKTTSLKLYPDVFSLPIYLY